MQKVDSGLWAGLGGVVLSAIVYFALRESPSDGWRVVLTLLGLLAPLGIVTLLDSRNQLREWIGTPPEPLLILLSGAAGLTVWSISWWLMEIGNEQLYKEVGAYLPAFFSLEAWWAQVIYSVMLLPLGASLLIFGLMRFRLSQAAPLLQICLLTLYFAIVNVLITPQGLVGLAGYGLLGLVTAFVVLRTGSFWAGLAAYGTFMYANLALLDNLAFRLGGVGYFELGWLGLVLICAFATLVMTQIIRFRTTLPAGKRQKVSGFGWAALVGVLLLLILYAASELDQRNEMGSQTGAIVQESQELPM